MRSHGLVAKQFWTGKTGKALRAKGRDVQVLALYLVTSPSSLWTGVYYLPLPTLCHEIGISMEGALKGLTKTAQVGFAFYDEPTETVWIPEMAKFQVGDSLKPNDLRITGLINDLKSIPKSPFIKEFYCRYKDAYHLPEEGPWKGLPSPLEAPSKGQDVGIGVGIGSGSDSEREKEGVGEGEAAALNGFGRFKEVYPIWKAEEKVKAAWKKIPKSEHERIFQAVEAYKQSADWQKEAGKFIPYPAKFLTEGRWKDTIEPVLPISTAAQVTRANVERAKQRLEEA